MTKEQLLRQLEAQRVEAMSRISRIEHEQNEMSKRIDFNNGYRQGIEYALDYLKEVE